MFCRIMNLYFIEMCTVWIWKEGRRGTGNGLGNAGCRGTGRDARRDGTGRDARRDGTGDGTGRGTGNHVGILYKTVLESSD
jgi:hypothetical protein